MMRDRKPRIMEMLAAKGFVNVQELADFFDVTTETIRRDLAAMEKAGLLNKVHGGAVATSQHTAEVTYQNRKTLQEQEKREIARKAASLISDGDTVIILSGTTTLALAEFLAEKKDLNVVTNSLLLAVALTEHPSITVHMLGGTVRKGNFSLSGVLANQTVGLFNASMVITGVGGMTPEQGLTEHTLEDALLLRECMKVSDVLICLADHTKFGFIAQYNVCPAKQVCRLITTSMTPDIVCQHYHSMGVQVDVVNMPRK